MHLMNFQELSSRGLADLVDLGIDTKQNPEKYADALRQKSLALIFQKTSTRTRVSFEVAMTQLGGHAHWLTPKATQIGHGESPKDTAIVLARYGHGIAVRDCRTVW